jgi:hypothetical protein
MYRRVPKFLLLGVTLTVVGCRSPRDSETERVIADTRATVAAVRKEMQSNHSVCIKALEDYEEAQGRKCKFLSVSRLSEPIQSIGRDVLVHTLEAHSSNCGEQNYKVRITYEDDTYRLVKKLEVIERLTL